MTARCVSFLIGAVLVGIMPGMTPVVQATDLLPSWNEGQVKQSIVDFVTNVTEEGTSSFVPVPERIAVFDNDGCLWSEQPMYFQLAFILDRVKLLAPEHPEWQEKPVFQAVLKGDLESVFAGGEHALLELAMATHAGMTTEEFEGIVKGWIATARHPQTGRLYTEMVYQPMLELLAYLRANDFKTFIVSGGGIEFMRPWAQRVYGIPPEQVIGSSIKTKFELRNGKPVILRLPEISFIDDKAGKPVAINLHIGRRPIAAFGNSDGDLQMLQWTAAGRGAHLCLYVHHTDAKREWAYDRQSSIGRLDKGLDEARAKGWTVVDMKRDWKKIYGPVSASGEKVGPREVTLVARWAGDYPVAELRHLPKAQRESRVGFIADPETFVSVWQAFKRGEPIPAVNFDKHVVVFVRNTQFYNRVAIGKATLTDGELAVLAMETMSARPIEDNVAMALAVVPRAGVKSIQGGATSIPLDKVSVLGFKYLLH